MGEVFPLPTLKPQLMKKIIISLLALIIVGFGAFYFLGNRTPRDADDNFGNLSDSLTEATVTFVQLESFSTHTGTTTLSYKGGEAVRLNLNASTSLALDGFTLRVEASDDATNWYKINDFELLNLSVSTSTDNVITVSEGLKYRFPVADATTTISHYFPIRNSKFLRFSFNNLGAATDIEAVIVKEIERN